MRPGDTESPGLPSTVGYQIDTICMVKSGNCNLFQDRSVRLERGYLSTLSQALMGNPGSSKELSDSYVPV